MSRSGYVDQQDNWQLIKWRGAVASAARGKRGQQFFADLIAVLDAMPVKELIAEELEKDGSVCALGALGKAKGIDMSDLDPEESEYVAARFGIAHALACEVMYINDEEAYNPTPSQRWWHVKNWAEKMLKGAGNGT